MIFHRLKSINNQKGFTMIELIMAIAVTAIITGGITLAFFQVLTLNASTSNHMTAVRQVQSAGYWVSHDTQMAQDINTDDDPDTPELELVTLTWTEYGVDGPKHQVDYTLEDMTGSTLKNLQRIHSVNGPTTETGYVAQYIDPDPAKTNCYEDADGVLIFTVTATLGTQSETRVYEVVPRPSA